jgi:peptidyl-prolyl cis-trans isomerase C
MQVAAEAASATGLDKDAEVSSQIALGKANVLSEALLKKYLEKNPITDADLKAEYDTQVASVPQEYSARHILVDDEDLAKAIIDKLKAGGDFAALAKQYSKDGSKQNGGDLGWFNPQSMVPEFAAAVTSMGKGKTSEAPTKTQFGWHVIRVEDSRSPQLPSMDQVKQQLEQLVQRKKVAAHLEELRKTSKLKPDALTTALTEYAASAKKAAETAAAEAAANVPVPSGLPSPDQSATVGPPAEAPSTP